MVARKYHPEETHQDTGRKKNPEPQRAEERAVE